MNNNNNKTTKYLLLGGSILLLFIILRRDNTTFNSNHFLSLKANSIKFTKTKSLVGENNIILNDESIYNEIDNRSSQNPKIRYYNGRRIIGVLPKEKPGVSPINLRMINNINVKWSELTKANELKFHPNGTSVRIIHHDSQIELRTKNEAIYTEIADIETTLPDGKIYRYTAQIDSQTGKILHTWNRPRIEYRKEGKLTPTGAL